MSIDPDYSLDPNIQEWTQHAENARRLAGSDSNLAHRQALLNIAAGWQTLIEKRKEALRAGAKGPGTT